MATETKQKILAAARHLFTTQGYDATSPRDVMDLAQAGQGSFYHHFRSKQALAAEALGAISEDLLGIGQEQLAQPGPALHRLSAYLHAERDALRGCLLGRFAYDPGLALEELRNPTARYFAVMEQLLIALFGDWETDLPASPAELAATSLAVIQGGYVLSRVHNDPAYLHRAVSGLWALIGTQSN
jgi:AcrR family transcriptional regulator